MTKQVIYTRNADPHRIRNLSKYKFKKVFLKQIKQKLQYRTISYIHFSEIFPCAVFSKAVTKND